MDMCDDIYVNRAPNFLYAIRTTKFPLQRICAETSVAFRTKSMNLMILVHATSINCATQCSLITLHSNIRILSYHKIFQQKHSAVEW